MKEGVVEASVGQLLIYDVCYVFQEEVNREMASKVCEHEGGEDGGANW